ncbi:MAG TPA: NADH-quinone oxidoreductase subunit L [Gemmataceae bacterium]|nr:NADH-quinone oxidoreductase subunit L [Gemmataceae bacterium]
MSDLSSILWLIPALPLAAAILITFLGPWLRERSHWLCILAALASCALSVVVLVDIAHDNPVIHTYYTWFKVATVDVGFTLRADALTAFMLVTVTFISSLIAIYASGYMHGDPGYARFFAEVSLFIFFMTGLVMADNFLLLYTFWEGVGLCSYLLIGFWFQKPAAAAAARKAFLVTRLGDIGLLIGILLIWVGFHADGDVTKSLFALDYQTVFEQARLQNNPGLLFVVCMFLFCGAVGKSAQFPLHVWLPDAMEGPTPVSALIHAATMVTAGVYLVARCTPLFVLAPEAQLVVACIGGFTALLAALIALTQNDLKRVLAYSTISQLGYMFLALGSATRTNIDLPDALVTVAVVAAMFHLFTHAFFKALLFLAAGSVMHSMGNVIDMRRFGGLRYALRTTHWTFLCGAGALAGVPLLAGFWSKDDILSATFGASRAGHPHSGIYLILLIVGLLTAGLTAFYTFRAYFMTFWGELRTPHEAGEHVHDSPWVMLVPLMILSVGALFAGYVNAEPLLPGWLAEYLERAPSLQPLAEHGEVLTAASRALVMSTSIALALGGVGLAWFLYVLRPGYSARIAAAVPRLYQLSLNKFYIDELYDFFIVQPLVGLAIFARIFDLNVVDGLVDLVGQIPRFLGILFRPIQNGLTQFYALAMALGLAVFLIALVWRLAW